MRARLDAILGRASVAITARGLEALAQAEQQAFERLGPWSSCAAHARASLSGCCAAHPLRGRRRARLERYWQPDALILDDGVRYEPLGWDVWRLAAAPLREDPGHPPALEVEAEEATSYQALLCVGALADEAVFPGSAELLHAPLEAVGFAVDAALHARWVANRDALGQVRRRIVDAEQVYRDQLESRHGPAWRAEDDRSLAREYEQVLQSSGRPGMLYATISLALGARSRDELERRVHTLRAAFGDVELFRPAGPSGASVPRSPSQGGRGPGGGLSPAAHCPAVRGHGPDRHHDRRRPGRPHPGPHHVRATAAGALRPDRATEGVARERGASWPAPSGRARRWRRS